MIFGSEELPERFWEKVCVEPNTSCWLWIACDDGHGYGAFVFEGKTRRAHHMTVLRMSSAKTDIGLNVVTDKEQQTKRKAEAKVRARLMLIKERAERMQQHG